MFSVDFSVDFSVPFFLFIYFRLTCTDVFFPLHVFISVFCFFFFLFSDIYFLSVDCILFPVMYRYAPPDGNPGTSR